MLTIDDAHTRDMDDAIEVEETPTGWIVRVAIADAALIVTPDSDLDRGARERGHTLYFAAGNSPMLPREIGEGSLSLWPKSNRRAVVAAMHLSSGLQLESTVLILQKIESEHKLSYKEIPAILADAEHPIGPFMRSARKLALGLLKKRREEGALVFYDLNNGWVTTEEGSVKKLKDHTETIGYIIVQELMVLANTAIADYAVEHGIPMLFRNHEPKPNAAPDRAEIQRLVAEGAVNPVIDLEAFQHRTHKLFEKASYGAVVNGHAGLSVKAYTHFTSPIRRYADLVVHQQLRAHIKGEPLPHSQEALSAVADHLNEIDLKERESASVHFKKRDERQAQRNVETRKLDGLIPKQFERVVKVEVRSGNGPSEALAEAWKRRLADRSVPTICMSTVLMHGFDPDGDGLKQAPIADGWTALKADAIAFLVDHTPDAITVLTQMAALGWPAVSIETSSCGPAHAPQVTGSAGLRVNGQLVRATSQARTSKDARQRAAVRLLAELSAVTAPEFEVEPSPASAFPSHKDAGKHPVSRLVEHAQALGCAPPKFEFTLKGEAHLPVVTCTATFLEHTISAVSASKQEAKLQAARLLVEKI